MEATEEAETEVMEADVGAADIVAETATEVMEAAGMEATEEAGTEVTAEETVIKFGAANLALRPLSLQIIQEVDDHRGFSIPFFPRAWLSPLYLPRPILPISKFTATHSLSIICIV